MAALSVSRDQAAHIVDQLRQQRIHLKAADTIERALESQAQKIAIPNEVSDLRAGS